MPTTIKGGQYKDVFSVHQVAFPFFLYNREIACCLPRRKAKSGLFLYFLACKVPMKTLITAATPQFVLLFD